MLMTGENIIIATFEGASNFPVSYLERVVVHLENHKKPICLDPFDAGLLFSLGELNWEEMAAASKAILNLDKRLLDENEGVNYSASQQAKNAIYALYLSKENNP